MKLKRLMFAAPKSGSGKTMITCAFLQILKEMGMDVVSYKCGPDYIDPMFHEKVLGIPSKNLDTFFTGAEETKALFLKGRTSEQMAVLEGVMGLFDGLGGIREEGSSYHLAKVTRTPVILVIDAKGMGYSLLPLISGFLAYDTEHLIQGIILNRMSKSYYGTMKGLIEENLHIPVVGYVQDQKAFTLESRHLGLKLPGEVQDLKEKIKLAADELQTTLDVERILRIAEGAEELEAEESMFSWQGQEEKPVLAVAKDEAFCFYYEDNLRLLEECGAKLIYFSPLHDEKIPEGCHGILLGGGYPELYAEALSANTSMLTSIREVIRNGIPSVAECGGFMYLHRELTDCNGKTFEMVGVIPETCQYMGKLVRFGYIEIEETVPEFLPEQEKIRGHEFHYFDSSDNGTSCIAKKPVTGKQYECIMAGENYWWGFPHLYYPSNPAFAMHFVEMARTYRAANLNIEKINRDICE